MDQWRRCSTLFLIAFLRATAVAGHGGGHHHHYSNHHHSQDVIAGQHHHDLSSRVLMTGNLTDEQINYCNATKAGEKDLNETNRAFNEWMASSNGRRQLQSDTSITVSVYLHVITSLNGLLGKVSESAIAAQMETLNLSFQPYFIFDLVKTNYVDNDDWYSNALTLETPRAAMMKAHRQGGSATLNIYTVDSTPDFASGSVLLGLAAFPFEYTTSPYADGVVAWHGTLPGGVCGDICNNGYTIVHEVGHWLGLFHTFHSFSLGGCFEGDNVDDTAKQAEATSGCPTVPPDTCPEFEGTDPIGNFMDYSNDLCHDPARGDGFSAGQIQRMRAFWDIYRAGDVMAPPSTVTGTGGGTSESVDVYIEFQYDRFPTETSWGITNSEGEIIVSYPSGSEQGLLSGTLPFAPGTYTLIILDSAGDGFCCAYGRGYVFVSVAGADPVGGYGEFTSTGTVTFTVESTAVAPSGGGTMTVPQGGSGTMVADAPPTPPVAFSSAQEQRAWKTLTALLALFAFRAFVV